MPQKSNHHLWKISRRLATLLSKSCNDEIILSIIVTEMFFRNFFDRFLEYITWILVGWIWKKRIARLSIGVAQIQLRHWQSMGYIDSLSPSLKSLLTVTSPSINYQACCNYLDKTGYKRGSSLLEVARLYAGKARKYYVQILNDAWKIYNTKIDKKSIE